MPDSHIDSEKLDAKLDRLEKQLDAAKAERKSIQLLMTFLTTIITAVVGFGGWLIQSHVQQHIDDQTHGLETRLALEQQVYAKELAAYESVHQQMANLVQSLSQVPVDPTQKKSAVDAISSLYWSYTTNSLYLSDTIEPQLQQLVDLAGRLPALGSSSDAASTEAVEGQIASIENQMKLDLKFSQLGSVPGLKDRPKP